jgi:hypothetical protein
MDGHTSCNWQIYGFSVSDLYKLTHNLTLILQIIVWNLACGFAQSEAQLLIFRFLAGLGGSAPLSVKLKFVQVESNSSEWLASSDWRWLYWGLLATR